MLSCSPTRRKSRRSGARTLGSLLSVSTTVGSLSLLLGGPWLINSAMSSQVGLPERYHEQLTSCNRQYDYTTLAFARCMEKAQAGQS